MEVLRIRPMVGCTSLLLPLLQIEFYEVVARGQEAVDLLLPRPRRDRGCFEQGPRVKMVHGLLVVSRVEVTMALWSRAPQIYIGRQAPGAEDRQPVGRKVIATSTTLEV